MLKEKMMSIKVWISFLLIGLAQYNLMVGLITAAGWATIVLAVAAGFGIVNYQQKKLFVQNGNGGLNNGEIPRQ